MDLLDYFNKIDINEINRMLEEGQEENIHIEFKTVNHPVYNNDNKDYDRKNLSLTLSGFSNSNGGIIVWGVVAKKNKDGIDVASDRKPILELTKFLNTLNRLEGQAVTPSITGVQHKKIEEKDDVGYIITYVPKSYSAPHMANFASKYYYKRLGDSFFQCEHYDIMDILGRKKSPVLEIGVSKPTVARYLRETEVTWILSIANIGQILAKFPLIHVKLNSPYRASRYGLTGNNSCGLYKSNNTLRNFSATYTGKNDIVLYPGLSQEIDRIEAILKPEEKIPDLHIEYILCAEGMEKISDTLTFEYEE